MNKMSERLHPWHCRDYRSGDEGAILELFATVFHKTLRLQTWRWRFIDNPFGQGIIKLLFDREKLIGHYAVTPIDVVVGGEPVKACFSMTTMTHPEYRGHGLFPALAQETYDEARRKGKAFVYGFPNRNSYQAFVDKVGWTGFGNVTLWHKELPGARGKPSLNDDYIHKIEELPNEIDQLWREVQSNYLVAVPRTKAFLDWRFTCNPDEHYSKYICRDALGRIVGYVVLKIYPSHPITKGHIVDMLSINDAQVVQNLLDRACSHFCTEGAQEASCFCADASLWAEVLKGNGFQKGLLDGMYFGARTLAEADERLQMIHDLRSWHLTMGDSDVF